MRKRDRDEVQTVARRRLESLSAELAALRAERGLPPAQPTGLADDADDVDGAAFFEQAPPVLSGPPGDLPGDPMPAARAGHAYSSSRPANAAWTAPAWSEPTETAGLLTVTPTPRPLPPTPSRVPAPGRHATPRAGAAVGERVDDWLDDRLPDVVRRRVGLSGQHLLVLTGVLGVAIALAGWLTVRGDGGQQSAPQANFVAQRTEPSAAASATASADSTAPSTATGTVVVGVVGKVRRPGIVTLPTGARVDDAIKRAGGLVAGARLAGLNVARVLVDGEQIAVGMPPPAGVAASAAAAPGTASSTAGPMVNINTAGLSELDTLPDVGPVTAQKILDYRTAHGSFTSVDQLLDVDGIGDKTLADIAPRVTL